MLIQPYFIMFVINNLV
ncbi:unnamed protein product [Spirodela intermedia]|uniref:Uncharacterized protein n=2 Tax=Spirodela intermedia TaxID=51605 RepID=A0A7I8IW00_SPIIN|nr:unnamed protein product [Spirodela intermedia]CAA6662177.1 unnamed protein product [Spirodela intermedia]CAA7398563.1 unnamed protein product [Spirodela intermedia]